MKSHFKTGSSEESTSAGEREFKKLDTQAKVRRKMTTLEFLNGGVPDDCGSKDSCSVKSGISGSIAYYPEDRARMFYPTRSSQCVRREEKVTRKCERNYDNTKGRSSHGVDVRNYHMASCWRGISKGDAMENACVIKSHERSVNNVDRESALQGNKQDVVPCVLGKRQRTSKCGRTENLKSATDNNKAKGWHCKSVIGSKRTRSRKDQTGAVSANASLCDKELMVVLKENGRSKQAVSSTDLCVTTVTKVDEKNGHQVIGKDYFTAVLKCENECSANESQWNMGKDNAARLSEDADGNKKMIQESECQRYEGRRELSEHGAARVEHLSQNNEKSDTESAAEVESEVGSHVQEASDSKPAVILCDSPQKDVTSVSPLEVEGSPPNSPLYDMPPPSTRAQKEARRLKRRIQLENNQKYEASLAREERQRKRLKLCDDITVPSERKNKTVSWKMELVSVVEIDASSSTSDFEF